MFGICRLYAVMAISSVAVAMFWQSLLPAVAAPEQFLTAFYRNIAGGVDGRSCPSYPVCSLYASQAVQQHGLLIGSWLMIDRLIHEHDDVAGGNWLSVDGEQRIYDPLLRNDFWLQD